MGIQHQRLYEQVITYINERIEQNIFQIGEKLPTERSLAEELNVSRGTLRDAFRVLESKNIIRTIPGGGRILISPIESNLTYEQDILVALKKAEILELLEARELLEIGMCKLVCERVTDEELSELEDIIRGNHEKGAFNASTYFHLALATATQNHVLENFIKLNLQLIKEVREQNFHDPTNKDHALEEHLEILEAIKKRDVQASELAVKKHFKRMRERLN